MIRRIALIIMPALLLAANAKVEDAKAKIKAGKFEEAIAVLEAEHKAQPKSDDVRTALVNAKFDYGTSMMNDQQLPPFRKYPAALRQFRGVLAIDKDHKKAKENIDLIEGIYKSMGRPVPQ